MSNEEYAHIMEEQDINNARHWEEETSTALELFERGLRRSDIKAMANTAVESVLKTGNVLQVAEALSAMEAFIKEVKDTPEFKAYIFSTAP